MTLQQLFDVIGENPTFIIIFFFSLPIISYVMTWITGEDAYDSPWKYIYSALIYAACIPGIFATLLIAYNMFFMRQSLLQVNLFVYFLPIISMIATLLILSNSGFNYHFHLRQNAHFSVFLRFNLVFNWFVRHSVSRI
jgi:hypothetical protein